MIIFILLAMLVVLAIGFGLLAYSANNRKRAAQKDIPNSGGERPAEHRATVNN